MNLTANVGSDRSWVYNAAADFSEGEAKSELLAIRFANSENANKFKDQFEQAKASNSSKDTSTALAGDADGGKKESESVSTKKSTGEEDEEK